MKKIKSLLILVFIILIVMTACMDVEQKRRQDYEKCTQVCSAVLTTEDYVTLHLCNEKCKEEFLNSS